MLLSDATFITMLDNPPNELCSTTNSNHCLQNMNHILDIKIDNIVASVILLEKQLDTYFACFKRWVCAISVSSRS